MFNPSAVKFWSNAAYITEMQSPKIRIASYNIRKARGLDQQRRPERILQVINSLHADVVVLQEADMRMGRRKPALPRALIEAQTDFDLVEISANGISIGWHGNAVLVRKGLHVRDRQRLDLPGLEPRGAVRLTLDIGGGHNGARTGLTVLAAHLGLRRRDRRAQLASLIETATADPHTVIAGDFNEWSSCSGLEPLIPHFEIHSPGLSFHARRPVAALDRFALSRGLELRNAGVEQGALARRASDHLPIWSDIGIGATTC